MPFLHSKNEAKICKIQKLLNYHPEVEDTFWGGVGVKKWSPFLDSGARSPIFVFLKMGTFDQNGQKCPFLGDQEWDFELEVLEAGAQRAPRLLVKDLCPKD